MRMRMRTDISTCPLSLLLSVCYHHYPQYWKESQDSKTRAFNTLFQSAGFHIKKKNRTLYWAIHCHNFCFKFNSHINESYPKFKYYSMKNKCNNSNKIASTMKKNHAEKKVAIVLNSCIMNDQKKCNIIYLCGYQCICMKWWQAEKTRYDTMYSDIYRIGWWNIKYPCLWYHQHYHVIEL